MKQLFLKYREIIVYLVFGVATTLVNIIVFFLIKDVGGVDYKTSNTISWLLAALFAFFTNKHFVFQSQHTTTKDFFKELALFYWYRGLSFVLDMGLMILLIDYLTASDVWAKLVTQVLVIILNYLFSKFFIFKKPKEQG